MSEETHQDDVLYAYAASAGRPNYTTLMEWSRRYPEYAAHLSDLTAAWSIADHLSAPPLSAAEEAALVQRGMSLIAGLARQAEQPATLISLLEESRARGLSAQDLAQLGGLSLPLALKLERRLLRPASIPRVVLERVAAAVGRDVAVLISYLAQPPQLAPGASYHAQQAPQLAGQEEFAAAVRADRTLSPDDQRRLLALTQADANAGDGAL